MCRYSCKLSNLALLSEQISQLMGRLFLSSFSRRDERSEAAGNYPLAAERCGFSGSMRGSVLFGFFGISVNFAFLATRVRLSLWPGLDKRRTDGHVKRESIDDQAFLSDFQETRSVGR